MRVANPFYDGNTGLLSCEDCPLLEIPLKHCFDFNNGNCPTSDNYELAVKLAEEVTNG